MKSPVFSLKIARTLWHRPAGCWIFCGGIGAGFLMVTRPGKPTKKDGKSPFLMGKSTISMAIFNSYVKLPEGMIGKYRINETWEVSSIIDVGTSTIVTIDNKSIWETIFYISIDIGKSTINGGFWGNQT